MTGPIQALRDRINRRARLVAIALTFFTIGWFAACAFTGLGIGLGLIA